MINIRPISDLRNKFTEIEELVKEGELVYLTKNGYGTMVVMSIEEYASLTERIDAKLAEAERIAEATPRYSHEEVFEKTRKYLDEKE